MIKRKGKRYSSVKIKIPKSPKPEHNQLIELLADREYGHAFRMSRYRLVAGIILIVIGIALIWFGPAVPDQTAAASSQVEIDSKFLGDFSGPLPLGCFSVAAILLTVELFSSGVKFEVESSGKD